MIFTILPRYSHVSTIVWLHQPDFNEALEEKARWELHKDATRCFEKILEVTPEKTASVRPLASHLTNYPSKTNKTGHEEFIRINSVCVYLLQSRGFTKIGKDGERESQESVRSARLADDDTDCIDNLF